MKLIMKTEFDNLKNNPLYCFECDNNGDKQVIKIYDQDNLLAKKVKIKKSIRYFAIQDYKQYLNDEEIE
jgi:hypothetical protein